MAEIEKPPLTLYDDSLGQTPASGKPRKHIYLWTAAQPDEWPEHSADCWCWQK